MLDLCAMGVRFFTKDLLVSRISSHDLPERVTVVALDQTTILLPPTPLLSNPENGLWQHDSITTSTLSLSF
jgi:hypothetical protein